MNVHSVSMLWIVWGVSALITMLLYGFRAMLTRDEEGQIFLDEAFAHEKAVQTQIVARVQRLQPVLMISLSLTMLLTLAVVSYYGWIVYRSLF
jgi:hypothetical protein